MTVRKERDIPGEARCPLCDEPTDGNLGEHIRQIHGEKALRAAVLEAKEQGMPDVEIGIRYGISFNALQEIITEAYGANISILKRPKRIKRWEPLNFKPETTTVWNFRQRGDWATHNGRYRGNWSPYIPRNIILRYSEPGDVVLDYFVGGGTTAVEAKLLGRRCIARDINPGAIGITRENLDFSPPSRLFDDGALSTYEPDVSVGDARNLSDIDDESIDLICAHPPYAGIIKYSTDLAGDLSGLSVHDFLRQIDTIARESLRILKPGGKCAILIGDARKSKRVVPIGFQTIQVFLNAGFILKELVIKRQHKCKTTGFWYKRSIKYNFLLLAHEYLPIFEKPDTDHTSEQMPVGGHTRPYTASPKEMTEVRPLDANEVETTTVWIFPQERLDTEMRRNLVRRFAKPNTLLIQVSLHTGPARQPINTFSNPSIIYVPFQDEPADEQEIADYRSTVRMIAECSGQALPIGGFLAVETKDTRLDGSLRPMGMMLYEDLATVGGLALKEIVIIVPDEPLPSSHTQSDDLNIVHRYLLVYERNG